MRLIVLVLVLWALVACKLAEPYTWRGVPDGPRVCSEWVGERAECVVDGAMYACVSSPRDRVVACARTSPLWTPESGK